MSSELKSCPFCNCVMRIESNRNWHKLYGDHKENCIFDSGEPDATVPAHYAQLAMLIRDWNTRTSLKNELIEKVNEGLSSYFSDVINMDLAEKIVIEAIEEVLK